MARGGSAKSMGDSGAREGIANTGAGRRCATGEKEGRVQCVIHVHDTDSDTECAAAE